MGFSDKECNYLSDQVYEVDINKNKTPWREGDKLEREGKFYKVLQVEDNTENGMQAMAVAPVIDGRVDTSQIVIAYAGTNFMDGKDRQTDINSVIFGDNYYEVADYVPSESQIDTALAFAEKIKTLYPDSNIETTGHSLGGFLATIVSVKNKWGMTAFNAPSAHKLLSDSEKQWAISHTDILVNYRNGSDWIGNFGGDPLGIERKVISYSDMGFFDVLDAHGLRTWQFNEQGNLVDKFGQIVDLKNYKKTIDINDDGKVDIQLNSIDIKPRDLLTSNKSIIGASTKIVMNTTLLSTLATNLKKRIQEDILEMVKITQLCIEKNQKISKEFESRKKQVSESIKDIFKQSGIGFLLYDLNHSVGTIINKKYLLEQDRNIRLNHPFTMHQTPIIDGVVGNTWMYQQKLQLFHTACDNLLSQVYREKNPTFLYFFGGEPTILSSWSIIEKAAQQLLKESDYLFEGEGLRLGKKDGISDSLVVVLDIILKNTKELLKSMMSAVEFIQGIATHFEQADQWLGQQLQDGKFVGEIPSPIVPPNYKAYLEQDDILDDVKDVLQAFDKQVEENSRKYAQKVVRIFGEAFGQFETGLQQWIDRGGILKSAIRIIQHSYGIDVHVQEEKIKTTEIGDRYTEVETNYWGKLEALYPGHTRDTIHQIHTIIVPTFDQIQQAIWQCDKIKGNLQYLEPQLKPVVEQGVYKAFDLDEIVQGQQTVLKLAKRLSQEIGHVVQVMAGEGMASKSIELLQHKLQDTQQLLNYYSQFVGDCFGDNEYSVPTISYPDSNKFRLN